MRIFMVSLFIMTCLFLPWSESSGFERFDVVTTEELAKLLEMRAHGNADFILVNTLDEVIYKDGSIPGSINIPWSQIETRKGLLGENKEREIITYCLGYR